MAEVDDLDVALVVAKDVVGLDVAVDVAKAVHVLEAFGGLDERVDNGEQVAPVHGGDG